MRYWHAPRIADVWQVRSAAITAIYNETEQQGIDMPFERTTVELLGDRKP